MLQLHFYSNHAGRLVLNNEHHDWWSFDTYPLESIKEFEQISQAWKTFLADLLRRGLKWIATENSFQCIVLVPGSSIISKYINLLLAFYLQKKMIRWFLWNFSDFINAMIWYQHQQNSWSLILNYKWKKHSMHLCTMVSGDCILFFFHSLKWKFEWLSSNEFGSV